MKNLVSLPFILVYSETLSLLCSVKYYFLLPSLTPYWFIPFLCGILYFFVFDLKIFLCISLLHNSLSLNNVKKFGIVNILKLKLIWVFKAMGLKRNSS